MFQANEFLLQLNISSYAEIRLSLRKIHINWTLSNKNKTNMIYAFLFLIWFEFWFACFRYPKTWPWGLPHFYLRFR